MKDLEVNWLKKFQSIVDKQGRGSSNYRQCSRCDKEVFTIRVFNKLLKNKTFKLKIKDNIYYCLFVELNVSTNGIPTYKYCGVKFHLGYSLSEYDVYFIDAQGKRVEMVLHYNDVIRLEYEEIPLSLYQEMLSYYI